MVRVPAGQPSWFQSPARRRRLLVLRRQRCFLALLRGILAFFILGPFCLQLVLQSRIPPPVNEIIRNARLPSIDPVEDSYLWRQQQQQPHSLQVIPNIPNEPEQQQLLYTCNDLFGSHQIVKKDRCLEHSVLKWMSCDIGTIRIDTRQIEGSLGGERIEDVKDRPEAEEKLTFGKGSLVLLVPTEESSSSKLPLKKDIIPEKFQQSMDSKLGGLLSSAIVEPIGKNTTIHDFHKNAVNSNNVTNNTLFLVRRGNYANPCMSLLTMYNVYIVMTYFHVTPSSILWLDGHAHGDLDPVWEQLFQMKPIHIRQYTRQQQSSINSPTTPSYQDGLDVARNRAIVVNTMSAIGDEGYGRYDWDSLNKDNCKDSTLLAFRDFVLRRYGVQRRKNHLHPQHRAVLTLLIRKDYTAHPRSNGRTDRTLANVTADVEYLRRMYPTHDIQVMAFEGLPFREQLVQIAQTDVFVAVHGAGNIHVLFLPDNATFVEYFPKTFERRRRFRYLAACVSSNANNITYKSKIAWRQHKYPDGKISVRLHPESPYEVASDIW